MEILSIVIGALILETVALVFMGVRAYFIRNESKNRAVSKLKEELTLMRKTHESEIEKVALKQENLENWVRSLSVTLKETAEHTHENALALRELAGIVRHVIKED